MARGIERSGVVSLLGEVSNSLKSLDQSQGKLANSLSQQASGTQEALLALASATAGGLSQISGAISQLSGQLTNVEDALRKPRSTAARERYWRGVKAGQHSWHEEAVTELRSSVEQDPFFAPAHLALGLSYAALGDSAAAYDALSLAHKYSASESGWRSLGAEAAIVASASAEASGEREQAIAVLDSALEQVGDCAELHLAHARLTGTPDHLRRALALAPELAVVAVASGIPNSREIAEEVASDPMGPVQRMTSAIHQARALSIDLPVADSTPALMSYHRRWRQTDSHRISAELDLARAQLREASDSQGSRERALTTAIDAKNSFYSWSSDGIYRETFAFVVVGLTFGLAGLALILHGHSWGWIGVVIGGLAGLGALWGRNPLDSYQEETGMNRIPELTAEIEEARDDLRHVESRVAALQELAGMVEATIPTRTFPGYDYEPSDTTSTSHHDASPGVSALAERARAMPAVMVHIERGNQAGAIAELRRETGASLVAARDAVAQILGEG